MKKSNTFLIAFALFLIGVIVGKIDLSNERYRRYEKSAPARLWDVVFELREHGRCGLIVITDNKAMVGDEHGNITDIFYAPISIPGEVGDTVADDIVTILSGK